MMKRLLAIALLTALVGCKKEEKTNFAPAKDPAPAPAANGPKNTNYEAGAGAIQNVRNAVKRTVEMVHLKDLGTIMTSMELENNRMPTKEAVLAALKADASYRQILELIDSGAVKLTGTTKRDGLWAYEIDSEKKGGLGLVAGVPNRYSADDIKTYLQGI